MNFINWLILFRMETQSKCLNGQDSCGGIFLETS